MNSRSFVYTSIAMLVALALAITMSPTNIGKMGTSYAQPTFGMELLANNGDQYSQKGGLILTFINKEIMPKPG
jgi:hypothetical protein